MFFGSSTARTTIHEQVCKEVHGADVIEPAACQRQPVPLPPIDSENPIFRPSAEAAKGVPLCAANIDSMIAGIRRAGGLHTPWLAKPEHIRRKDVSHAALQFAHYVGVNIGDSDFLETPIFDCCPASSQPNLLLDGCFSQFHNDIGDRPRPERVLAYLAKDPLRLQVCLRRDQIQDNHQARPS